MFKISKKFFLSLIISLSWSQIEFAPDIEDNTTTNPIETSEEQTTEENKEINSRERLAQRNNRSKAFTLRGRSGGSIPETNREVFTKPTPLQEQKMQEEETAREQARKQARKEAERKAREEAEKNTVPVNVPFSQMNEGEQKIYLELLGQDINLDKPLSKQNSDIQDRLNQIEDKGSIGEILTNKIQDLSQEELLKIDPNYLMFVKPDQIKDFTIDTINTLTNNQLINLVKKEDNKNALKERIKTFTPEEIIKLNDRISSYLKFITSDQIKALFAKPNLVSKLNFKKIQALDPKTLADAIKGDLQSNLKNKFAKRNPLPQSFVDALTPEQAEDIIQMHKKAKGRFFDSNDLKYYFSDSQIKMLENKAQAAATGDFSKESAEARNILITLVDKELIDNSIVPNSKQGQERTKLMDSFKDLINNLSTKDKEQIVAEYTDAITKQEESKWFGLKKAFNNKKLMTDLKNKLNTFINDFVQPTLNDNEWAFEYTDPKTNKIAIKIIEMNKALVDVNGNKVIPHKFTMDENLTFNEVREEYAKYFVAKKIDLSKPLQDQTKGLDEQIITSIENAVKTKINTGLENSSIKIEDLDPTYISYINDDTYNNFKTEQYKNLENKMYTLSPAELTSIYEKSNNTEMKKNILSLLQKQFINSPSSFNARSLNLIDNNFLDTLSMTQLKELEINLSKLSDDQLNEIFRSSNSSELREAIYKLNPKLGTVAVRPERTMTSGADKGSETSDSQMPIIAPEALEYIRQQQELISKLNNKNAGQLVPQITALANKTTEEISDALDKITEQRKKGISTLNKYLQEKKLKELSENSSDTEIQKAVRGLSLIYHPDKNTTDTTTMSQINGTRNLLIDELPEQAKAIADKVQEEQKVLTNVRKNKNIALTPEQFRAFSNAMLQIALIVKTYANILEIQPEQVTPTQEQTTPKIKQNSNPTGQFWGGIKPQKRSYLKK